MTALRQLLPEPAEVAVDEAVSTLRLSEHAPQERPYLVVNMVSTADGKVTIDGRAGPISNPTDQAILYGLRAAADAVMVGAGTARAERYGNLWPGGGGDKLAILVSAKLSVPDDLPLFAEDGRRVVVLTASDGELEPSRASVEYLRGDAARGELALAPMLAHLRRDLGVRSVVCEGGPTLNSALLRQGLVDEFHLAVAPKLAGGTDVLTAVAGPPFPDPIQLDLLRVLEEDSYLYLRYRVRREQAAAG